MAYVISSEMTMDIESVIWEMPYTQVFKLSAIISSRKSIDSKFISRKDSIVSKKLYTEIVDKRIKNGKEK